MSRYFLLSLPVVLAAVPLGRWLNRRLDRPRFLLWVHLALVAIGVALRARALGSRG